MDFFHQSYFLLVLLFYFLKLNVGLGNSHCHFHSHVRFLKLLVLDPLNFGFEVSILSLESRHNLIVNFGLLWFPKLRVLLLPNIGIKILIVYVRVIRSDHAIGRPLFIDLKIKLGVREVGFHVQVYPDLLAAPWLRGVKYLVNHNSPRTG
jgi:hypothetical protein